MAKIKLGNVKGPQGAQGPAGPAGPQGAKGATGPAGPQGVQGPKGDAGPAGPQGAKGATGPTGPKGATGTRGSQWYTGTAVTGTSTAGAVFSGTGIASALIGDIYLNTSTGYVYACKVGGAASAAKWAYMGSIRGPQGAQGAKGATGATGPTGPQGAKGATGPAGPQGPKGEPTTVDAALSATSKNPVQNKVVKAEIDGIRDLVSRSDETTLVENQWGAVRASAFGPIVALNVNWTSAAGEWNNEVVATLPDGMRPTTGINAPMFRNNDSNLGSISIAAETDGSVRIINHGGTQRQGDYIAGALCFIAG